jgi:hypothetical protein
MSTRSSRIFAWLPLTLLVGLLAVPEANAQRSRGGHAGGQSVRPPHISAPHISAPRQTFTPARMPRATAPSRTNVARAQSRASNAQAQANRAQAHAVNAQSRAIQAQTRTNLATAASRRQAIAGALNPAGTGVLNTTRAAPGSLSPYRYTYGYGNGARGYRPYGYGRGYRNASYGRGYGYGRSQGYNRGLVQRLRSVHTSLARLDHDYQGHRVRAMHAISMAVRQLTHRSMVYSGVGFAPGMNNLRGMGMNNGQGPGMRRAGLGAGGRRSQLMAMPQAQSDARMSQALRTLQGINMQLQSQSRGFNTPGHGWVIGHIQRAIHELNIALSIR